MPLEFVRTKQQLLWNNGTRLSIPGVFLDKGAHFLLTLLPFWSVLVTFCC